MGKVVRGYLIAERAFEMGGGELNEGLEIVARRRSASARVPQPLQHFVRFPPVPEVIEIDRIQIVF
jgi:hypothetical protein